MKKTLILAFALLFAGSLTCVAQKGSKTTYKSITDMIRQQPGVTVRGEGENSTIYIRGIGTNTDQFQPLFVVDGVITPSITYLAPEDVSSINVIKDGTASIYGMQGANGVIEITTKTGEENKKQKDLHVIAIPDEELPEGQIQIRMVGTGKMSSGQVDSIVRNSTRWFIDDREVTADEVEKIKPSNIMSMEIKKDTETPEVRITTNTKK